MDEKRTESNLTMEGKQSQITLLTPTLCLYEFSTAPDWTGREKRQAEHEAGRLALAKVLFKTYGLSFSKEELETEIAVGDHGKPFLKKHKTLFFNISHSGNLAVCAVEKQPIGVDVEYVRTTLPKFTSKILSEREQAGLAALPEEARPRAFFALWTLKESYVKALGVGVTVDMTAVEFEKTRPEYQPPDSETENRRNMELEPEYWRLMGPEAGHWQLECRDYGPYVISVCRSTPEVAGHR